MSLARVPVRTPFYYGWVIVVAAALMSFSVVTFFQPILSVFMLPLQEEFGWSRSTIAGAVGIGSLAGAVTSPFVGRMLDRWGGRWIMAAMGVVMGACLLALARVQGLAPFYVFYIIGRTAVVSVSDLAASVAVSNWFVRNRGPAMGFMNVGTRTGQAFLPAAAAVIILEYGWRAAFLALALVVVLFAVLPAVVFVRRRPEDVGLVVDGGPGWTGTVVALPTTEEDWQSRDAVRTKAFWLLTFATSITFFAASAINLHLVPYLQDAGLAATTAVGVLSLMSLAGGAGGLAGGLIERRFGARATMACSLGGQAIAMVLLAQVHTLALACAFAAYFGVINGATQTLNAMIFATYFGRRSLGTIRGLASPVQLLFNATGPFLGGVAYDLTGSYSLAFAAFALLYLAGALAMIVVPKPASRPVAIPQRMST
jgi:MFS family permease